MKEAIIAVLIIILVLLGMYAVYKDDYDRRYETYQYLCEAKQGQLKRFNQMIFCVDAEGKLIETPTIK